MFKSSFLKQKIFEFQFKIESANESFIFKELNFVNLYMFIWDQINWKYEHTR